MTPQEAIRTATEGAVLPLYLLVGEERLLRDRAVDAIVRAALGGGLAELNVDKMTAGEVDVESVVNAARTVPMMAKRRVVLVRSLERWDNANAAASDDVKRLGPLDALAEYAKAPSDTACVVLVGEKLDGRRKLFTLAKKEGFLVECALPNARELPAWVRDRAKEKGHAISRDVCELIAEIAGTDLSNLDDVIERLSLFVGEGAPITEEAVAACVTRVKLADTWKLVDAVATRDLGQVMQLFADVYDPRDHGLPLLGALAWRVRQLAKLQAGLDDGQRPDEAGRAAGIFPAQRAREAAASLRAFRPRELERWLLVLQETDIALKSSRRPADLILSDMFTRLCRRAA
ncbi:MAG: DNA polymerase III subunit delta [Myxococcales bacterium]|nr:DNA polymerase III subunit delta [Myxococcales bacterium]